MLDQEDYFSNEKIKLLLKIFQVLLVVVGTMSIVRFLEKEYAQFLVDISFLVILLFGYHRLTIDKKQYKIITRLVYSFAIATSIFILFYQPENPIRVIWVTTNVYIVFYLFDRKEAVIWVELIGILLTILYFFHPEHLYFSINDFLIWIMNMLIILMISQWYSKIEDDARQKFLNVKNVLSKEVKKKTEELEKKTYELQFLNKNLEKRIQEKIEKSIEQEKMLFRQARYAQMGEMIGMIAHQWRQPLNAISTVTATIQLKIDRDDYDSVFITNKVNAIGDYVQHLSATIDDFRNFFKLDREKEELAFANVIKNTLKLVGSALENKNIAVEVDYGCYCTVYTYPNEIQHVILNIVKNAEDALLMNGISEPKITIRTMGDGTNSILEIEDNASGIDEKIMEKIFDPYFTTKENSDGTGLGLYMSRIIIEEHCNGKIEVENGKEGAIFRLLFPIFQEKKFSVS